LLQLDLIHYDTFIICRSFDEASPRVKKGRFGSSSSLPISPNYKPLSGHTSAQGAKVKSGVPISFDDSHYTYKNTKVRKFLYACYGIFALKLFCLCCNTV